MIIYNVTIKVSPAIHESWLRWMKEEHLPEVLATGCFHDSKLMHLFEQDDAEGFTYAVQFISDNMENYETYINEYAPQLRQKTTARFGDQLVAFRTVMRLL
jgi:hypothetical protein